MAKLGFGKYADLDLTQVPGDYLEWLSTSSKQKAAMCDAELARRELAEDANASTVEQMLKAGYRSMSKQHHPDMGGSTEKMQEVNAAFEKLKSLLR